MTDIIINMTAEEHSILISASINDEYAVDAVNDVIIDAESILGA